MSTDGRDQPPPTGWPVHRPPEASSGQGDTAEIAPDSVTSITGPQPQATTPAPAGPPRPRQPSHPAEPPGRPLHGSYPPPTAPPARSPYPSQTPPAHSPYPSQTPPPARNRYPSQGTVPPTRTPYPSQPAAPARYRSQPPPARRPYPSQPAQTPARPPYPSQPPLPPPPSRPLPPIAPSPPSGPAPVPPPPPPVFGNEGHFGAEHAFAQRTRQPSYPPLDPNYDGAPADPHTTQQLRVKTHKPALPFEQPPGKVVDPNDAAVEWDAPPPLPDDHPSLRSPPAPLRDDLPPPSERTATFVGIVGEPLPFSDEPAPDPTVRKRALLRLGTPANYKATAFDPPAVLRTFRSLSTQFDEDTQSAIHLPIGGVLPFEPKAGYTITLEGVADPITTPATLTSQSPLPPPGRFTGSGTLASPLDQAPSTALPLPFSAAAGDTPELLQTRDAARLQHQQGDTSELPDNVVAQAKLFAAAGETISDPVIPVSADPLPFRASGATQIGIEPAGAAIPFGPPGATPRTVVSQQSLDGELPPLGPRQTAAFSIPAGLSALPFDGPSTSAAQPSPAGMTALASLPSSGSAPAHATPAPHPTARPETPAAAASPAAARTAPAAVKQAVAKLPQQPAGGVPGGAAPGVLPPNPLRAPAAIVTTAPEPEPESKPYAELQPLLDLELYAKVKVGIWDRALTLKQALSEHGIDEMEWRRNEERHAARIDAEAEDGKATFAQQVRNAVKRVRAETEQSEEIIPIERYAELRVLFELADHEEQALADTDYSLKEWEQIKRSWSKRLRGNRDLSKTLRRAMAKARRKHRRAKKNKEEDED